MSDNLLAVEWTVATRGTFTAHVMRVASCDLSIIGGDKSWFWLVSWEDDVDTLAEGTETTLTKAKEMAEAALQLVLSGSA
ncbi:MAG: hypothetical protein ACJ8H8_33665 [Geminicoccaceae bacterium]